MLEKMKQKITTPSKGRDEIIGLVLLLIFVGTSFAAGVSFGRSPVNAAENAKTNAQLARMEAAVHSRACQEAVVDAARELVPAQRP